MGFSISLILEERSARLQSRAPVPDPLARKDDADDALERELLKRHTVTDIGAITGLDMPAQIYEAMKVRASQTGSILKTR